MRRLGALAAVLPRLLLALGLHPRIDRLAVLLRQIGPPQPHIDDIDAEGLGLGGNIIPDLPHDRGALFRQDVVQGDAAQYPAQAAGHQCRQPRTHPRLGPDRLVKLQRIDDAVAGIGVGH